MVLEGIAEMFFSEKRRLLDANIPADERHGWKPHDKPVILLDVSSRPP